LGEEEKEGPVLPRREEDGLPQPGGLQAQADREEVQRAVDKARFPDIEDVSTMNLDLETEDAVEQLREWIGGSVDVVLSDMSPRLSGNWSMDQARSAHLSGIALTVGTKLLRRGGNAATKVFEGDMYNDYLASVKKHFSFVKGHRPKATISESAEIYVIAKGFRR
jgi:23S rRNA (uridine2552-2'-O)-methyltransferase